VRLSRRKGRCLPPTPVCDGIVRGKVFSTGKGCGVEDQEVQTFRCPSRSDVVRLPASLDPVAQRFRGAHIQQCLSCGISISGAGSAHTNVNRTFWILDHLPIAWKLLIRLVTELPSTSMTSHTLPGDVVVVVGGGPVGLILARVLSHHGVKSLLFERNETTTSWPKMDLTNARSMELFKKIGLADELRKQGVDPDIDQDVLISTGMERDHFLTKWDLPSVNKFRTRIFERNDGSQPREPWQRISQAIFEKWLKNICDQDPLIDLRFAWKVTSVAEDADKVVTTVEAPTGETHTFSSVYVAGCDGGSSSVRRSLRIPIDGGPM
jgi:hypothetical protein